jgi:hypothetical protein
MPTGLALGVVEVDQADLLDRVGQACLCAKDLLDEWTCIQDPHLFGVV